MAFLFNFFYLSAIDMFKKMHCMELNLCKEGGKRNLCLLCVTTTIQKYTTITCTDIKRKLLPLFSELIPWLRGYPDRNK